MTEYNLAKNAVERQRHLVGCGERVLREAREVIAAGRSNIKRWREIGPLEPNRELRLQKFEAGIERGGMSLAIFEKEHAIFKERLQACELRFEQAKRRKLSEERWARISRIADRFFLRVALILGCIALAYWIYLEHLAR